VIPGLVYSLLGSSRQLNVGAHHLHLRNLSAWCVVLNSYFLAPEAALALLVGQAVQDILIHPVDNGDGFVSTLGRDHPERLAAAIATLITFQVGVNKVLEHLTAYW
jgi:MFS superfamily sulfate permease-like transporter